jgi:hypothetical protein
MGREAFNLSGVCNMLSSRYYNTTILSRLTVGSFLETVEKTMASRRL